MAHPTFSRLFRQSVINLLLIVSAFMLYNFLVTDQPLSASRILVVGLPLILGEVMGVDGFIRLLKRRREPKDFKYFIALIINALITLMVAFTLFVILRDALGVMGVDR